MTQNENGRLGVIPIPPNVLPRHVTWCVPDTHTSILDVRLLPYNPRGYAQEIPSSDEKGRSGAESPRRGPMPADWTCAMAVNGHLPYNTSGESGHWTMASSEAANHDDDLMLDPHIQENKDREKEKSLQKKLGELQTQIQRLERRLLLLRTENDGLKKKQEEQKPLEDKVKVLKKRNAELAAIARRLEEKAKALQQENAKNKTKLKEEASSTSAASAVDGDHLKRVFARQRAKDLAEHAKNMLAKDREIEDLRKKCQELADQLSNGELMAPQNVQIYEEKEELVNIVKQAAKERLQLEQQLAHSKTKESGT
ncbi:hypothetical protein ACOMHN_066402 [Nucella lapillus]